MNRQRQAIQANGEGFLVRLIRAGCSFEQKEELSNRLPDFNVCHAQPQPLGWRA